MLYEFFFVGVIVFDSLLYTPHVRLHLIFLSFDMCEGWRGPGVERASVTMYSCIVLCKDYHESNDHV
jgi:hypothetical protein